MNWKSLFYIGATGLALFEVANVYFIMPMPGSQRMGSLDAAYFLHEWRWAFRAIFGATMAAGFLPAFRAKRWLALLVLVAVGAVIFNFNFKMAAEKMFYQPTVVRMADSTENKVGLDKLVLGIELNGQAKAYPIQYIGYHHQVRDTVGGEPVMVTYCTVCRTGRVYAPKVNGEPEDFRLVGMDHFNAMFEDATTKSWWRQVTGEAVAGPLKGAQLPEIHATQTSLREWFVLYPSSLVMQADSTFSEDYANLDTYDFGVERGRLTRTDTLSWQEKSWVVGIESGKASKAFDWNRLKQERVINDQVGERPVVIALADDDKSFFAFERPDAAAVFSLKNDTLFNGEKSWNLLGKACDPANQDLIKITAYQEFWHSWMTFHPYTTRY
ncbi:MAG: DUF3179 domain-containing protein [Saprospiraceae bacterium]|nr:DUF3179 domain-containing protein [Saprospiraceae bacterium]